MLAEYQLVGSDRILELRINTIPWKEVFHQYHQNEKDKTVTKLLILPLIYTVAIRDALGGAPNHSTVRPSGDASRPERSFLQERTDGNQQTVTQQSLRSNQIEPLTVLGPYTSLVSFEAEYFREVGAYAT